MPDIATCPTCEEPLNERGRCGRCSVRGFVARFADWLVEQGHLSEDGEWRDEPGPEEAADIARHDAMWGSDPERARCGLSREFGGEE